jgi:hypothetical protein
MIEYLQNEFFRWEGEKERNILKERYTIHTQLTSYWMIYVQIERMCSVLITITSQKMFKMILMLHFKAKMWRDPAPQSGVKKKLKHIILSPLNLLLSFRSLVRRLSTLLVSGEGLPSTTAMCRSSQPSYPSRSSGAQPSGVGKSTPNNS